MTIAITDKGRLRRRRASMADAVRAKIASLESGDTHVLHSVSAGAADHEFDHLVIGPGGVFAVMIREDDGRDVHVCDYAMTIDGTGVPYLRQAKYEAERIARALASHVDFEVPVRGCVVLLTGAHAPRIEYESRPIGVSVLTKGEVPRWFRKRPAVLDGEQVNELLAAARRPLP
jgi:hypothetical protein